MYATVLNGEIFEMFDDEKEAKETVKIMRKNEDNNHENTKRYNTIRLDGRGHGCVAR
jgi:hypothetical protein